MTGINEVRERLAGTAGALEILQDTQGAADLRALLADHVRLQEDAADPWRGLYDPARMPALDGLTDYAAIHPDTPMWDDDREEGVSQLIRAQGFEVSVVTEEYPDDDGALTVMLAAWEPGSPGDDWRLAAIYDTEDSDMAAMFVRPLGKAVQS